MVFAEEAINDLLLITDYHTQSYSYCGFSQPPAEANRHAEECIEAIIAAAERLVTTPFRGECHHDLLPGLCHLALDRAVTLFVHTLSSEKSRCWPCFLGDRIISDGCWCACSKTAPRVES